MMCKNPWMRRAPGRRSNASLENKWGRLAATPFPCGQCLPCRINKSREWTHRLLLEASQHDDNCFITLTYDEDHVPEGDNLNHSHITNYFKKLRKSLGDKKIRYFTVGEYGGPPNHPSSRGYRPHYHIACFGIGAEYSPLIKNAWTDSSGEQLCNWAELDKRGGRYIGDLNNDSARYITGYTTKKLTRERDMRSPFIKKNHPQLYGRTPEFARMSRRPGIGNEAMHKIIDMYLSHNYGTKQILRTLKTGGHNYPLGRYLTNLSNALQDITPEELELSLKDYQAELFNKHLQEEGNYYQNVVKELEQQRKNQEWKFNNMRTERSL